MYKSVRRRRRHRLPKTDGFYNPVCVCEYNARFIFH